MLERGLVVCNGKGGVGKSSVAANLAATAAAMGWHTLLVDLDPRGSIDHDLGYRQSGATDEGESLWRAVAQGTQVWPVQDVRRNLDVVPGGGYTEALVDLLAERVRTGGLLQVTAVAEALAPLEDTYDLVMFDTPPSSTIALDAALCAGRGLLVPCRFDAGSLDGLEHVSDRFCAVREEGLNPDLELVGVALFGFGIRDTRLRDDVRADLEFELGGVAPVFDTYIRDARKAARHMRTHGLVASEYLTAAREAPPWYEAPDQETFATNAEGLAHDYWNLSIEVLDRFREIVSRSVEARVGASS
jgi:cellulose biosynthesis protein BcsQ